ncbi:hypothetical protein GCM10010922_19230 [Microbacterium sorbitolivorans]|uniref:DUF1624 domain-containing protein n=1 Tax=Microbacterium sorbitolivorans TaxID=1867410 RepID=A0A367Y826_9MICO|nr:heparan-alpha-glucosaminide N-acetyltransferase domain-containing protein [Microbacterium sorbitolivorans]RCK62015.1 DUF1624 domain-containing protein [Microbacterium sorbitolivorans]GGF43856.1 hypothetical protein GCM10010922_19230 [Microbacterium sorbitolivorans]
MATLTPSTEVTPATPSSRLRAFGMAPRIVGLDIARGLAVLGMAAAHTVALPGEIRWSDPSTWVELVSGRSSILFAVLAGVSIALMTGRSRIPTGAELATHRLRLVARGLVIFAIGLVLELLGTNIAVILTFYGAVYAVAVMFIGMRAYALVVWAAAMAVAGPAVAATLIALSPSASGAGISFILEGTYSIVPWTALMLAGLALGRLDITRRKTAALALAVGVALSVVGYTAGSAWGGSDSSYVSAYSSSSSMPSYESIPGEEADLAGKTCEDYGDGTLVCYSDDVMYTGTYEEPSIEDSFIEEPFVDESGWAGVGDMIAAADIPGAVATAFFSSGPHTGGTMEILGSGGLAIAIIALLVLTGDSLRYALLPLAAVGSMPLTAYSAHIVAIWIVIGPGGWDQPAWLYPFLAVGLLIACSAWAILVGRGPLERLTAWAAARLAPAATRIPAA